MIDHNVWLVTENGIGEGAECQIMSMDDVDDDIRFACHSKAAKNLIVRILIHLTLHPQRIRSI